MQMPEEKEIFVHDLKEAYKKACTEPYVLVDAQTQNDLHKWIKATAHRGPTSLSTLIRIFPGYTHNIDWLMEKDSETITGIFCILLKIIPDETLSLLAYMDRVFDALDAQIKSNPKEETSLLFRKLELYTSTPGHVLYREEEQEVIERLKVLLGINWEFVGKEGFVYANQREPVPIIGCILTTHTSQITDNHTALQDIEKEVSTGDRYLLFSKEEELVYNLIENEKKLLYLAAKHYLNANSNDTEVAAALCRQIILEGYSADALLLYSHTLMDRPFAKYSLLCFAEKNLAYADEREKDILLAECLSELSSHNEAYLLFQKHNEVRRLIDSLCKAGRKEEVIPLIMEKIEEIKKKLEVENLSKEMNQTLLSHKTVTNAKADESSNLLRIELASHLFSLGKLQRDADVLKEAFTFNKTRKYAKALCTQLLLDSKIDEAADVLESCTFEVMDKDSLLLTVVTLIQKKEYSKAERILNYAYSFNQTDERIESALHVILIQQGKTKDLLERIYARVKTYSSNIFRDCNSLFTFGFTFNEFFYCGEAISFLYQKTQQIVPKWSENLYNASIHHPAAKEALLNSLSQMKTLDVVENIKKTLNISHAISPEIEYFARKRIIEYTIHTKKYEQGEEHLAKMKSLSMQIDQDRDYLDTVYAFFKR
ncbi:hypothetical protein NEFER03_1357 [Nematocida sp. LUAm3]|nr:hypothetical protein NEFER03_1357 [Nematocida sp. LUAm3]KAI5174021.1 hypothetical protein NEFER02_0488 [Nematocida sp. LUAm2]KAI5177236.1 hypothetical protein NEFER01_0511 [Nematocida sp. LUAm1]